MHARLRAIAKMNLKPRWSNSLDLNVIRPNIDLRCRIIMMTFRDWENNLRRGRINCKEERETGEVFVHEKSLFLSFLQFLVFFSYFFH